MPASRYTSYADYMRRLFGQRVQKLSVDAGFTCPNRDGTLGTKGCTFCNNDAFCPSYCKGKSISQQIDEGIAFHQHRYRKARKYVAYFQAYSNTYADISVLSQRYEEALQHPDIVGLIVGTRPDCVDEAKLDYLASLQSDCCKVVVEYGVESCFDETLRKVCRGHLFIDSERAIQLTASRGIACGAHLIVGLPGEGRAELMRSAAILSQLPINSVKLHQLQVVKGSVLASQVASGRVAVESYALDAYIQLVCDFVERLRPDIAIERFAGEVPPAYQLFPDRAWRRPDGSWLRNEDIPRLVDAELEQRQSWQGKLF
ncbi:MAG: TIGR01212 family radical SAM protein [Bacteroidales bacterium]|nr:TIGR01212 family radical SAM protein [Candidatus Colimorpha onthohippi]